MNERLSKLSSIVKCHKNFSLDTNELRLYYKNKCCSTYQKIKDIVYITQELSESGIDHIVYDNYIDAV